uniref:C2H2-type domain-containing protein n=1 Tax=Glossina austeni TaxID=7395 RepID=A0A1A9V173_GLOAU
MSKSWTQEQIWLKDVLKKSGTDLVELQQIKGKETENIKILCKENGKVSSKKTMVYYQSTPLIIKSEHPSQAQLCANFRHPSDQLQQLHPISQHQHQQLHQQSQHHSAPAHNYSINDGNLNMQRPQHAVQLPLSPSPSTSISNVNAATTVTTNDPYHQQHYFNIKTELLPPDITVYATSQPAQQQFQLPHKTNASSSSPPLPANTTTVRKISGNKPQFKCEQCGMIFGSKSAHTSHTKSHNKSSELSITSGTNAISNSCTMVELNEAGVPVGIPKQPHIKPNPNAAVTGGDPYQCNVCQKTFAVPARLIRHYRTHTGERPFECEFCHKLFSVKENLQVHRRIHTKERPYKCDVCGRAFEHSGKLHRHMRIHTGERPHKCSVCEKTFIQSGQLVIHMRTHTGEKPYKCPVEGCGKGFTCSKQLKVHSRTHTGEKPYHCDICFRDFGYNHVLKLHRVQHYGSKCYKCTICDETFKSKKEMEAHIKGHAHEMPDDEDENVVNSSTSTVKAAVTSSSSSTSSGIESNSAPNSPQSPSSSGLSAKTTNAKKTLTKNNSFSGSLSPPSPGSPNISMSPSPTYASTSRHSAGSPTFSAASPTMSITIENEHYSRESGLMTHPYGRQLASHNTTTTLIELKSPNVYHSPVIDDMPTDLSITPQTVHSIEPQRTLLNYHHYQQRASTPPSVSGSMQYHYLNTATPLQQLDSSNGNTNTLLEPPTINPALLEAASIASRREDDIQQAAIQIMQLHRSQQKCYGDSIQEQISITPAVTTTTALLNDINGTEDKGTNEVIEHYKKHDLTRHSLTKGYAPVPKFESSLHNNDIILRQVEAAIAPLRASTESPERSSSPESDSLMMLADRDVMTLPLRKRKLYMSDLQNVKNETTPTTIPKTNENNIIKADISQKMVRQNSVIQFAKAS